MNRQGPVIAAVAATAVVQLVLWWAGTRHWIPGALASAGLLATAWMLILGLAMVAARRIDALQGEVQAERHLHRATLDQVEQIGALNEMLLTLGRSKDVGLTFQGLARRIGRWIPCDRLGLALIDDASQQLQTFSARVSEPERRRRPRAEVEYNLDRSIFGQVVRSCEPLLIDDLGRQAAEFQDASALASQGFKSALVLPLISRNRAIGALTVISRNPAAFASSHRDALQPLAEVLAFAFLGERQHQALERFKTMEAVAETSLSVATDINGALQAIVGECGLLAQAHPELAPSITLITEQAERIVDLLGRMRVAARERLHETVSVAAGHAPSSPEAFNNEE